MKNRHSRLPSATEVSSLGDVIEIEGDMYVVTNLHPFELTDIEHYGRETTGGNG